MKLIIIFFIVLISIFLIDLMLSPFLSKEQLKIYSEYYHSKNEALKAKRKFEKVEESIKEEIRLHPEYYVNHKDEEVRDYALLCLGRRVIARKRDKRIEEYGGFRNPDDENVIRYFKDLDEAFDKEKNKNTLELHIF